MPVTEKNIVLCRDRWVRVLSAATEQEREARSLSRTPSEPTLDLLRDRDVSGGLSRCFGAWG